MNFKRLMAGSLIGAATLASPAAFAELSANVGVTSQYLFRGLAQTDGAAINGGLDYASESGFYVGTWGSTINFGGSPNLGDGGSTGTEVDFYAGFGGEAGSIGYDIGLIYYWYSEEDELDKPEESYNTIEVYGSLSFGALTLGGYFAPDTYFGVDESAFGINLGLSLPITEVLSFEAFVGHNGGDGNEALTPDGDSYLDYSIGLSASAESGLTFGFALVATDIDDDDLKAVISGGYSFGL